MLSRRLFLKGAAATGLCAGVVFNMVKQVERVTLRHGYVETCGKITEICTRTPWPNGTEAVDYHYRADHVRYKFPEGEIRRVWLDGKEVAFNQTGEYVNYWHLGLGPYGNRIPEAMAEIVA